MYTFLASMNSESCLSVNLKRRYWRVLSSVSVDLPPSSGIACISEFPKVMYTCFSIPASLGISRMSLSCVSNSMNIDTLSSFLPGSRSL